MSNAKGYSFKLSAKTIEKQKRWWNLYNIERESEILGIKRNVLEETTQELVANPASEKSEDKLAANESRQNREFFRNLPRALLEILSDRLDMDYAFNGNIIRSEDDEGALPETLKELPDSFKIYVQNKLQLTPEAAAKLVPTGLGNLGVYFKFYGSGIEATVLFPHVPTPNYLVNDSFPNSDRYRVAITPFHDGMEYFLNAFSKFLTPRLQLLAKFHSERVWKNTLPTIKKEFVNFTLARPNRWQKLKRIADTGSVEFLSDYHFAYGYSLTEAEMKQPIESAVDEELNELSVLHDLSWKKRLDNIYLVKNNRWYRDDYMGVPTGYLNKLIQTELPNTIGDVDNAFTKLASNLKSGESGKATSKSTITINKMRLWLDRAADIASNLSPWQIGIGLKFYVPNESEELTDSLKMLQQRSKNEESLNAEISPIFRSDKGLYGQDAEYILKRYRTIPFYSTLKKEARTKLLGEGLLFDELNADQRDRAIWLLPRIGIMLKQGDESPKVLVLRPLQDTDSYIPGKLYLKETLRAD